MDNGILPRGSAVKSQRSDARAKLLPIDSMTAAEKESKQQAPTRLNTGGKTLNDIGRRVEAAHQHARLTHNALESQLVAAGFGGRGYLTRVKSGARSGKSVDPRLIELIADICGVDFHWLATGRGTMLPPRTPPVIRRADEALLGDALMPRTPLLPPARGAETPLPPSETGPRRRMG